MGTNNLHGELIMLKEKNCTCNSAIGRGQHRPSGGGLTLGGGQGCQGDLQAELETHNLTSCLELEVACPLPPTEVVSSIISTNGDGYWEKESLLRINFAQREESYL